MRSKKKIKHFKARSSITGKILKDEFYIIHTNIYSGLGYCLGPKQNYKIDLERSITLVRAILNAEERFIPECNFNTNELRREALSKNLFHYMYLKSLPVLRNERINVSHLRKHMNENKSIFVFNKRLAFREKDRYEEVIVKFNGINLYHNYSIGKDLNAFLDLDFNKRPFFVEKEIFEYFTRDFDALFPSDFPSHTSRKGIVEGAAFNNAVIHMTNFNKCLEEDREGMYDMDLEKDGERVDFFISKLADHGISLETKAKSAEYHKELYEAKENFDKILVESVYKSKT